MGRAHIEEKYCVAPRTRAGLALDAQSRLTIAGLSIDAGQHQFELDEEHPALSVIYRHRSAP